MLVITLIALLSVFVLGAIFFIDCKIVEDLPESNSFKRWWRQNVIASDPKG
jgi:hypothetical protein